MVTISDLRRDSWKSIAGLLKAGGQPRPADIAAALRRNEPTIPGIAQDHIAALLTGKIKRTRGGQALPIGEHPASYQIAKQQRADMLDQFLILSVLELAKQQQGDEKARIQAAIVEIARLRKTPDAKTLRRYYTKACARWPEYLADAMQAE